jgi:hypothetical protein
MKKTVTLLESDDYTMLSSWQSEIAARSTANGGCILMAWVFSSDLEGESPSRYRSGIIQTAKGFVRSWEKCCDVLEVTGDIDETVIARLGSLCPRLAPKLLEFLEKLEKEHSQTNPS